MFGSLGFGEILVICVVLIIVVGPDKLPSMMKQVGKAVRTVRQASRDIQSTVGLDEILRDDVPYVPPPAAPAPPATVARDVPLPAPPAAQPTATANVPTTPLASELNAPLTNPLATPVAAPVAPVASPPTTPLIHELSAPLASAPSDSAPAIAPPPVPTAPDASPLHAAGDVPQKAPEDGQGQR